jgi:hypothetical protein
MFLSSWMAFWASDGDAYLLLNVGLPSIGCEAFVGETVDAMRTPARPPSVAKRTKRGRGFGVFRFEAADDVDDDKFERVAAPMPKRGSLTPMPGGSFELLHREIRLLVANMGAVGDKSRTGAETLEEAKPMPLKYLLETM